MNCFTTGIRILFKRRDGTTQMAIVSNQLKKGYIHVKWIQRKNGENHYYFKFVRIQDIVYVFTPPKVPLMTKFLNLIMPFMKNSSFWFIIALTLLIIFVCEVYNNYKKVFMSNFT